MVSARFTYKSIYATVPDGNDILIDEEKRLEPMCMYHHSNLKASCHSRNPNFPTPGNEFDMRILPDGIMPALGAHSNGSSAIGHIGTPNRVSPCRWALAGTLAHIISTHGVRKPQHNYNPSSTRISPLGILYYHRSCRPPITALSLFGYPISNLNTPRPRRPAHRALFTTPLVCIPLRALRKVHARRVPSHGDRRAISPSTQVQTDGQIGRVP